MDKVIWIFKDESGWGGSEHMHSVGEAWPKQPRAGNQSGKWDSSACVPGRSRHLYLCTERKTRHQGPAQWPSTQRAPAQWASGGMITLKAAVNIWAENLFFMEKPLLFPEIWDYQISVWMAASCLTAVSVCANVKMERVMHLYSSPAFGFPTGNPFCPKAGQRPEISATFSGGWS